MSFHFSRLNLPSATLAILQAIAFTFIFGIALEAHSAPTLNYTVLTTEGLSTFQGSATSRGDACSQWAAHTTPYGSFLSAAPKPGWDVPNRYENVSTIPCIAQSTGGPSEHSAGYAHCAPTWQGSSTFVVDKTLEQCVCPAGKVAFPENPEVCVALTEQTGASLPPNDPANLGPGCPQPSCGEPINPGTGNMWHIERDYSSASQSNALSVTRVYNSSPYNWDKSVSHAFGMRWTQPYDAFLRAESVSNTAPGKCWQRQDTLYIWCDAPAAPPPSAIPDSVSILRGDGKRARFNRSGTTWSGRLDSNDGLTANYNDDNTAILGWTFVAGRGDVTERYDANGVLISITARNGTTQRLTYSDGISNDSSAGRVPTDAPACTHVQSGATLPAGRLMCVTDHWGRQLNFEYDIKGRIVKVIDPAQQTYLYEYDGPSGGCITADINNPACSAGNLTKITFPDGKSRTYFYNEAAQINGGVACTNAKQIGNGFGNLLNAWTGLVDENGARHISWTYDCLEHATSSQLGQGANKVTITYPGSSGRSVTHYFGTSANPQTRAVTYYYSGAPILGVVKNTTVSATCAECGDVAERLYDSSGNITSLKDWNGNYRCFAYGQGRNLETVRVEGGGGYSCSTMLNATTLTLPSRKISTQWHANYNLPLMIAAPKKLTTYSYDTAGNLVSKSESATNDTTGIQAFGAAPVGAPRTWTYTYNAVGQMQTVTGPRTDVNDTTTYAYDSQGNLVTITNAAGHVTSLANYDAHGRVGRVTAPNGTVTEMSYTQRGWLSSRAVTAGGVTQTTTYDYDNSGQLTHVALPGGSSITYTYDDAHRLTGISDEIGNSVLYTLDFRGNRLKEQVTDPTGALARQITRVYDTLNRLQQQTGGVQ